jgi:hypothetical protein
MARIRKKLDEEKQRKAAESLRYGRNLMCCATVWNIRRLETPLLEISVSRHIVFTYSFVQLVVPVDLKVAN